MIQNITTSLEEFNREIRTKIPIVEQMDGEFTLFSPTEVRLQGRHLPNINHVGTVFGGSLYAMAALACYGLFRAMAESFGFTEDFLVIQEGNIQYKKPVTSDFTVIARKQEGFDLSQFLESVQRQGKGRIPLRAEIIQGEQICAIFEGVYVLRLPKTGVKK